MKTIARLKKTPHVQHIVKDAKKTWAAHVVATIRRHPGPANLKRLGTENVIMKRDNVRLKDACENLKTEAEKAKHELSLARKLLKE